MPRKQIFLDTYVKLNQPKEAVAEAKQILADDPKDFWSLYYTMSLTRALAGNNPTPDVLDQGEKATNALLSNIDTPPPGVAADKWLGARTPVEVLGHSTWDGSRCSARAGMPPKANSKNRSNSIPITAKRTTSWAP